MAEVDFFLSDRSTTGIREGGNAGNEEEGEDEEERGIEEGGGGIEEEVGMIWSVNDAEEGGGRRVEIALGGKGGMAEEVAIVMGAAEGGAVKRLAVAEGSAE